MDSESPPPAGNAPEWSVSDVRSGMIAVGLVMHHDGDAFTGIELVCRDVLSIGYTTLQQDSTGY